MLKIGGMIFIFGMTIMIGSFGFLFITEIWPLMPFIGKIMFSGIGIAIVGGIIMESS